MREYRFYHVDGSGRISWADWIQAANDDEAVLKARELRPGAQKGEVWHQTRLVATLKHDG